MEAVELDGSTGEGGGQIVRTGLFLSLLLQRPVRVHRIRAGRPKPGLKPQHAGILRLLEEMTGSRVEGGAVGSMELAFTPGRLAGGEWRLDVGTAGAIPLVLQTLLPVMLATPAPTRLRLRGGTDVPFAPSLDWLRRAYLPYLAPLADVTVEVHRRGFAPEGGGEVEVACAGAPTGTEGAAAFRAHVASRLGARRLAHAPLAQIGADATASRGLGAQAMARLAFAAQAHLLGQGAVPEVHTSLVDTDGPGCVLAAWAVDAAGNAMASDRLVAGGDLDGAARIACQNLLEDWRTGAPVDRHLADHVVPWVALGAGAVKVPQSSSHLRTNAWVCQRFLGEYAVRVDRNIVR